MTRFSLHTVELEADQGAPEGFGARAASIHSEIGGEHLAGSVIEIPPGQRAWPYHWEAALEEWLYVLTGTPTVRTPDGEEQLRAGDLVCFVAGPDGAHQVLNDSDATCRVVMLSNQASVNVVVYPDADKVGARTPWLRPNFPHQAAIDYWQGE